MGEPYGFWNPPEGPDGYPGDAIIEEANAAADLRAEVRRLRLALEEACCEYVKDHVDDVLGSARNGSTHAGGTA